MTGILTLAALVTGVLGHQLGLPSPTVAGTFAGALTNTPALAAATERSGDATATTVGYSISYLWGVIGMLLGTAWTLRRRSASASGPTSQLTTQTIRIERTDRPRLEEVMQRYGNAVVFSRVQHGETNPILVAADDERLEVDDLVSVVGKHDLVDRVARELGHASSHDLVDNRHDLDFRRITLSQRSLAGRTVAELDLPGRFGAAVTRVRRGDVDMVATEDLVLQPGDRLRVIVAADRMKEVSRYLGDSERGLSDINPVGFAVGMTVGVLLGLHPLPAARWRFRDRRRRRHPDHGVDLRPRRPGRAAVTTLAHPAASALSNFGMLAFLAYAGTRAGRSFTAAVTSSLGWRIALLGLVVTSLVALAVLFLMRALHHMGPERKAGVLARLADPAGRAGVRQRAHRLRQPGGAGLRHGLPGLHDRQDPAGPGACRALRPLRSSRPRSACGRRSRPTAPAGRRPRRWVTSTRTVSPSRTSPASSALASRSPISRCTSRRSGRAP